MFATDMGAGELEFMAQEIAEQHPRFDAAFIRRAIDLERNVMKRDVLKCDVVSRVRHERPAHAPRLAPAGSARPQCGAGSRRSHGHCPTARSWLALRRRPPRALYPCSVARSARRRLHWD